MEWYILSAEISHEGSNLHILLISIIKSVILNSFVIILNRTKLPQPLKIQR